MPVIPHIIPQDIKAIIIVTGCKLKVLPKNFGSIIFPIIICTIVGKIIIKTIVIGASNCKKATGKGSRTAIIDPKVGIKLDLQFLKLVQVDNDVINLAKIYFLTCLLIFSQVSDFFLPLGPTNKNNVKTTTKISFPMKFAPLLRVEYVHSKKGKFKKDSLIASLSISISNS